MHALRNPCFAVPAALLGLAAVLAGGPVQAGHTHRHSHSEAPSPPKPAAPPPAPSSSAVPDYGGRDSSPLAATTSAAPSPAAQAGRALEALIVVLAGVVGAVYALKRFGLVKPGADGGPARLTLPRFGSSFGRLPLSGTSEVTVVSSQTLPGGTMLHVVRVAGKSLLLAVTAHAVTTVAEWPAEEIAAQAIGSEPTSMIADFEGYLTRADPASGIAAANARLRSLLSPAQPEETP